MKPIWSENRVRRTRKHIVCSKNKKYFFASTYSQSTKREKSKWQIVQFNSPCLPSLHLTEQKWRVWLGEISLLMIFPLLFFLGKNFAKKSLQWVDRITSTAVNTFIQEAEMHSFVQLCCSFRSSLHFKVILTY